MDNTAAVGNILQCLQIFLNALQKFLNALQIFAQSSGGETRSFRPVSQCLAGVWREGRSVAVFTAENQESMLFFMPRGKECKKMR